MQNGRGDYIRTKLVVERHRLGRLMAMKHMSTSDIPAHQCSRGLQITGEDHVDIYRGELH